MSWLFSQALVAEYSAASCSDGAPSALLSANPMPQAFLPPDKMKAFSRPSRFGMTFAPLTVGLGSELLTWFLEGFRAKTSAHLAPAQDLTATRAACGWKWQGSWARYDRNLSLWKTRQCSLLGDWDEFSETWPRWGLMLDGELLPQPMLAPPTGENESGSWPTPQKHDITKPGAGTRARGGRNSCLNSALGGRPHPEFHEWLMGWPATWTDLAAQVTDKYRLWLRLHGGF